MADPISSAVRSPASSTINMAALDVPPPRAPAAGACANTGALSAVRDEFAPAQRAPGAPSTVGCAPNNPRAQLRSQLEQTRRLVEQIPLPPPRTPSVQPPRPSLAALIDRQRTEAMHHARTDALLTTANVIAHNTPLQPIVTALSLGTHVLDDLAEGATPREAVRHAAVTYGLERLDHAFHGNGLVMAGRATLHAAAHILHDGDERVRVAQQESEYLRAQEHVQQQDRFSRMDGENAGNGIGNPQALTRLDAERLRTDRAYAVAVRQTIERRLQSFAP